MARQPVSPRLLLAAEIAMLATLGVIAAAASMPFVPAGPAEAEAARHDIRRQVCSGSNSAGYETVCSIVHMSGLCCDDQHDFVTTCGAVCCNCVTPSPSMSPTTSPTPSPSPLPTLAPTPSPTPLPTASPTGSQTWSPIPSPTTQIPTACGGSGSGGGSGDDDVNDGFGCDDDDDFIPEVISNADYDDTSGDPSFASPSTGKTNDDDGLSDGSIALIVIAVVLVMGIAVSMVVHKHAADHRQSASISSRSKANKGELRVSRSTTNKGMAPFVSLREMPVKVSHI